MPSYIRIEWSDGNEDSFDPEELMQWMVTQAESFGNLADVLKTAAAWFYDEAERARLRVATNLQILMTVVIGAAVGFMAYTMLGTIMAVVAGMYSRGLVP
jgi:type II secretory pathway component PulF